MNLERSLALIVGDHGRTRDVVFREAGIELRCRVNEDNLWGAVKDVLVLGEYERSGIALRNVSGVVVDAGAHAGLFALLVSAHAQKVVALEAHPDNVEVLEENVARNRRDNVDARHAALWSVDGTVTFVEGPVTSAGSILARGGRPHVVPSVRLDSVLAETGPIDLLKLDIEGAEFDVLDAASDETLRQTGAIVGELHLDGRAERVEPLVDRLRSLGFSATVRRPPIWHWAESMRALWRNRRRLRGEARLRLAVPAVYTVVALGDPVLGLRNRLDGGELAFIYASRAAGDRRRG